MMRRVESSILGHPLGRCAVVLLVAAAGWGCGSRTSTVTGVVTVNGKPLAAGSVVFHNARGETALAWIGEDGTYRIDNVPRGTARVAVGAFTRQPDGFRMNQNFPQVNDGPLTAPPPGKRVVTEMISSHYGDPESSGLFCDVRESETRYDIPLIGTPAKKNPRSK